MPMVDAAKIPAHSQVIATPAVRSGRRDARHERSAEPLAAAGKSACR